MTRRAGRDGAPTRVRVAPERRRAKPGGRRRIAALVHVMSRLRPVEQERLLRRLTPAELRTLNECWEAWSHAGQRPPAGDWTVWLIRAGRGFGKTRAGAEWVSGIARANPDARIALVGATLHEVRRTMVEGESGLLAVRRSGERIVWRREAGEVRFGNGARAFVYSADSPESLRGPEHHAAWCDELAKWRRGEAAWDNLMMGMRLGDLPRTLITTTPRSVPLMRRVTSLAGLVETRGRTTDNPHLPGRFVEQMIATYDGTRTGRQELDGEIIDDVAGALWTRELIERCRVEAVPALVRVVVAVDPPAGTGGDACGIVAVARGEDGRAYVLEDASVAGASPETWARAVAACAMRNRADRVVAEANQGGAMVRSVLMAADAALPIMLVHATQGKVARAEPVMALYSNDKARHRGAFPALEDEMCGLIAGGGYEGPGRSPDRADALVWAMSALMLAPKGTAGIHLL